MAKRESWEPFWVDDPGCWAVDFRVEGIRIRKRLPISDRSMKKVAVEFARDLYRETWKAAIQGRNHKQSISFREAAEFYRKNGGEGRFLDRIVKHFSPRTRVDAIDELAIARAAEALYPLAKPDTVRRQLKVPIRAVQNFAAGRRRQRLTDTPRMRWLSPEEAERLLEAAAEPARAGLRDPRLHTLRRIAFMLGTGAGPGETIALTVDGWNPATREWWLPGTKSVFRQR